MTDFAAPTPNRARDLTWGVVLLFILLWSPFIHSRAYSTNDASRMASIESLVHRQTWQIDNSPFVHTLDKIRVGESFYSTKPPVLSFVGAGVYALLYHGLGWELQTQGCAPDLSQTHCRALLELETADWAYFALTFLLIALPGIVMLALAYRLAWRAGLANWMSVGLTLILGLGTAIFPFSTVFLNHVPAVAALFVACYILFTDPRPGKGRLFLLGFLATLATTLDLSAGVYTIGIVLYAAYAYRRNLVWVLAGAAVPVGLMVILDYQIVGNLLPPQFYTQGYDYEGSVIATAVAGHRQAEDVAQYIFRLFLGDYGLFAFYPIVFWYVFAVWAAFSSVRERVRPLLWVVIGGTAVYILYFALNTWSFGGFAFGVRWLLIPVPLLAFFSLLNPTLYKPRWRVGLIGLLAAISIVSTYRGALNPWNPAYPILRLEYAAPKPRQQIAAVISGYASFEEVDPAIRQGFGTDTVLRRWVDTRFGIVVPNEPTWWFIHESTPVAPQFAEVLGLPQGNTFTLQANLYPQAQQWLADFSQQRYRSDSLVPEQGEDVEVANLPVIFVGEFGRISLQGYQIEQEPDNFTLTTAWQVEWRSLTKPAPRQAFVHVLAQDGSVVAQSDFFAADYASLFPEDLLFQTQKISLTNLPPGTYWIQLGLYNPDNGERFILESGRDRVLLFPLEVTQ